MTRLARAWSGVSSAFGEQGTDLIELAQPRIRVSRDDELPVPRPVPRVPYGEMCWAQQNAASGQHSTMREMPRTMVVMPVRGDDQGDRVGWVDAKSLKIPKGLRCSVGIQTGIDSDPHATTDMHDNALAIAWTEKR